MRTLFLSSLLLPAALVPAQTQALVSPKANATVDGSAANNFPWTNGLPKRYMQIHGDVGGTSKLIKRIAGRRDGDSSSFSGTRKIDLELFMGDSRPWNDCSFVIPNNYLGTRTQVVTRQTLNFGPFAPGTPAPFDFAIPFTTPFPYAGTHSLAWEMLQYSNTAVGLAPTLSDVDVGSVTDGPVTLTGAGCIASGQSSPMTHEVAMADVGGTFAFGLYLDKAPANALAVLYIGTSNPARTIPGICGPLYTDLALSLPLGTTDANGFIGAKVGGTTLIGGPAVWMLPNTFGGTKIYTQAHAVDAGSANAIPIVNSDGRSFTVPQPNRTKITPVSRILTHDSQTTSNALFFAASSVGYGAVVQFMY